MKPRMYGTALAAILAAATLLLAGCAGGVPGEQAGIEGVITSVTPGSGDVVATILVESPDGTTVPGMVSDKASVTVTSETRGFTVDEREVPVTEMLEKGAGVRVWFEGPVAESYPVQGAASAIQYAP